MCGDVGVVRGGPSRQAQPRLVLYPISRRLLAGNDHAIWERCARSPTSIARARGDMTIMLALRLHEQSRTEHLARAKRGMTCRRPARAARWHRRSSRYAAVSRSRLDGAILGGARVWSRDSWSCEHPRGDARDRVTPRDLPPATRSSAPRDTSSCRSDTVLRCGVCWAWRSRVARHQEAGRAVNRSGNTRRDRTLARGRPAQRCSRGGRAGAVENSGPPHRIVAPNDRSRTRTGSSGLPLALDSDERACPSKRRWRVSARSAHRPDGSRHRGAGCDPRGGSARMMRTFPDAWIPPPARAIRQVPRSELDPRELIRGE